MAVDEVRQGVMLANEKSREALAAIQQASQTVEEAQQALAAATSGSAQEEIQQSHGMLAEAGQQLSGVTGTIHAAVQSAETYVARL